MTLKQSERLAELKSAVRAGGYTIGSIQDGTAPGGYSDEVWVAVYASDGRGATYVIKRDGRYSRTAHMKMNPNKRQRKKSQRGTKSMPGPRQLSEWAFGPYGSESRSGRIQAAKREATRQRSSKNPLPVGKLVTVRAIRRKNGQVDIYG